MMKKSIASPGDYETHLYTLVDMNPKLSDDYRKTERLSGLVVFADAEY